MTNITPKVGKNLVSKTSNKDETFELMEDSVANLTELKFVWRKQTVFVTDADVEDVVVADFEEVSVSDFEEIVEEDFEEVVAAEDDEEDVQENNTTKRIKIGHFRVIITSLEYSYLYVYVI